MFCSSYLPVGVDLLEPVMTVEVACPEGPAGGDVISDLSSHKRGRITEVGSAHALMASASFSSASSKAPSHGASSSKVLIRGQVPLREMVGYSTYIRSKTAGEGSYSMEFAHYAPVGPQLQRQLQEDPFAL